MLLEWGKSCSKNNFFVGSMPARCSRVKKGKGSQGVYCFKLDGGQAAAQTWGWRDRE